MASGPTCRAKRPNTWLHRPMLHTFKKVLANSEPSTHGGEADMGWCTAYVCFRPKAEVARPLPSAMLVIPVRCALGGDHETTGIYQPHWWRGGCMGTLRSRAKIWPRSGHRVPPTFFLRTSG